METQCKPSVRGSSPERVSKSTRRYKQPRNPQRNTLLFLITTTLNNIDTAQSNTKLNMQFRYIFTLAVLALGVSFRPIHEIRAPLAMRNPSVDRARSTTALTTRVFAHQTSIGIRARANAVTSLCPSPSVPLIKNRGVLRIRTRSASTVRTYHPAPLLTSFPSLFDVTCCTVC